MEKAAVAEKNRISPLALSLARPPDPELIQVSNQIVFCILAYMCSVPSYQTGESTHRTYNAPSLHGWH